MSGGTQRRAGVSLVEMVMGLTILTTGLLTIMVGLVAAHKTVRATGFEDEASLAFEDLRETMRGWDFSRLYGDFHGRTFKIEQLRDSSGAPAMIEAWCYVDETKLPSAFAALADIDGDDQLATTDCSTTYTLLPVELRLSWDDGSAVQTRAYFFVVGPDA